MNTDTKSYITLKATPADVDALNMLVDNGFQLSGSRFFNMLYPEQIVVQSTTDWDFCGQYGVETVNLLLESGFEVIVGESSPYTDGYTKMIVQQGNIQIALRENVDSYMSMFASIDPMFYKNFIWKSGPNSPSSNDISAMIHQLLVTHEVGQIYAGFPTPIFNTISWT